VPKGQSEENSVELISNEETFNNEGCALIKTPSSSSSSGNVRKEKQSQKGHCRVVKMAVRSSLTASTLMLCIWVDPEEHLGSEGTPIFLRSLLNCSGELVIVCDISGSREENGQLFRC
jgi:hypothetical protein